MYAFEEICSKEDVFPSKVGGRQVSTANRKSANLAGFQKMWHFADLRFAEPIFLCSAYLKLPQARKYILFLLTNIYYKALAQIVLYTVFPKRGLLGLFPDRIVKHSVERGFVICGLMIKKIRRISDLRTGTHKKFEDLRKSNKPKSLRICDVRTLN
jgi:hypothetical protein